MPAQSLRLRPPHNRVERRAIGWWITQELLTALIPALLLAVLAVAIQPARFWLLLLMIIILLIGIPYAIVVPLWRYSVHRWETTADAVYAKTGWLWQEWRIAPMSRIQTVDTERGPLVRQPHFGDLGWSGGSAEALLIMWAAASR